MQLLIPAITIKAALAGFEELGLKTADLLTHTGFTPTDLKDPFAALPNTAFAQLWAAAFQQLPDPTLPTRSGFAVPFSQFGLLDHLVKTADSIGEALHMLNLFLWLVSVNMSLRFTHTTIPTGFGSPTTHPNPLTLFLSSGRWPLFISAFGRTSPRLPLKKSTLPRRLGDRKPLR